MSRCVYVPRIHHVPLYLRRVSNILSILSTCGFMRGPPVASTQGFPTRESQCGQMTEHICFCVNSLTFIQPDCGASSHESVQFETLRGKVLVRQRRSRGRAPSKTLLFTNVQRCSLNFLTTEPYGVVNTRRVPFNVCMSQNRGIGTPPHTLAILKKRERLQGD